MEHNLSLGKSAINDHLNDSHLTIQANEAVVGYLRPISKASIQNTDDTEMLARWRNLAQSWFTTQFHATPEGTRQWLEQQVIEAKDRVLFIVETSDGPMGQVGLCSIDFTERRCELDNILRGVGNYPGMMYFACRTLLDWASTCLKMDTVHLRVFSDNDEAVRLYNRLGFEEIQREVLTAVVKGGKKSWIPPINGVPSETERELVTMMLRLNGLS